MDTLTVTGLRLIWRRYGSRGVSLTVPEGGFFFLLCPNVAGLALRSPFLGRRMRSLPFTKIAVA